MCGPLCLASFTIYINYMVPVGPGVCNPWKRGRQGTALSRGPRVETVNVRGVKKPAKEPGDKQNQKAQVTETKGLTKNSGTEFSSVFRWSNRMWKPRKKRSVLRTAPWRWLMQNILFPIFNEITEASSEDFLLTNPVEAPFSELHKCHLRSLKNIWEEEKHLWRLLHTEHSYK